MRNARTSAWAAAIVLATYGLARILLAQATEQGGLITPSGSVSPAVLLLGLLVVGFRIVLLFIALPLFAYRLVGHVLDRFR